jgi:hypothetical protein
MSLFKRGLEGDEEMTSRDPCAKPRKFLESGVREVNPSTCLLVLVIVDYEFLSSKA